MNQKQENKKPQAGKSQPEVSFVLLTYSMLDQTFFCTIEIKETSHKLQENF